MDPWMNMTRRHWPHWQAEAKAENAPMRRDPLSGARRQVSYLSAMDRKAERGSQERQLALLVSSAVDYAIFMLDVDGHVLAWNAGAERMKRYRPEEIIGRHFSIFYTEEDVARGHPDEELRRALADGRYEEEGWRVRKDGTRFWGNIVITPVHDESGELIGFGKVSRDLTARRIGEERTRARNRELESANEPARRVPASGVQRA